MQIVPNLRQQTWQQRLYRALILGLMLQAIHTVILAIANKGG
jgi:hypothetical protein